MKKIAIIGRGISGASCGLRLIEKGYDVHIFSKDDLAQTTSMSAGAFWWPFNAKPLDKVKKWSSISYHEYKKLLSDPQSGISFQRCLRFCEQEDDTLSILEQVDDWHSIDAQQYGVTCAQAFSVIVPVIDVPIFMPYLERRFLEQGGSIFIRTITAVEELFDTYDVVVNCCGLEAYHLVNDKSVYPIRGQVLSVAREESFSSDVRIILAKDYFTMILPRHNDYLLGGTADVGDWSLIVNPQQSIEFKNRCEQIMPELKQSKVLSASVGLRPGRDEIRLQLEQSKHGKTIIHNYGHGGGGYTVAWGCADDVASLVNISFQV